MEQQCRLINTNNVHCLLFFVVSVLVVECEENDYVVLDDSVMLNFKMNM